MFETESNPLTTFDAYSAQVEATWRREEHDPENWQDNYADLIRRELGELWSQHGVAYNFLRELEKVKDPKDKEVIIADNKVQFDGLVEELGDLLWFSFRSSAEIGLDPKQATAHALSHYTRTAQQFRSFSDLEQAVSQSADFISVPSKWALRHPEDAASAMVQLRDSPGYVLMRVVYRLGRALDGGRNDFLGPPTASMLEPLPGLAQSIGDCINVVAYISRDIMEIPTEEVARRNIDKLQHRLLRGKSEAAS